MKAILRTISVLIALSLIAAASLSAAAPKAILSEIKGKVQVKPMNGAWTDAAEGMSLDLLTTVSTGFDSSVKILIDKNVLFVKPLTRMTVDKLVEESGKVSTTCFLRVGSVNANIKSAEGVKQDFKVMSPYSTASVRGTRFDFDGKKLKVWEGNVVLVPGRPTREFLAEYGLTTEDEAALEADFAGAPEIKADEGAAISVTGGGKAEADKIIKKGPGGGGGAPAPTPTSKPTSIYGGVYIELQVEG